MKYHLFLTISCFIISCAHKEKIEDNTTMVEITLADSQCAVPVVSKDYYFESYNKADKKKKILDTKILNGRKTIYSAIYEKGNKYVFSIKKQPNSELILKKTVKFLGQKKIDLYIRACD